MSRLSRLTNYERTRPDGPRAFGLERPRLLLERLGRPDLRLGRRVVQVAGTKGKGSTSRFLESIFRAGGMRTGRFLSPHIERVEERIAIDGVPLAPEEFGRHVEAALDAAGESATFFETTLAASCLAFAEAGVEATVLEVGLGGRYDATTAVPATTTVITEISYDHMEVLGTTLELIAAEKAAIARPGVPMVSGVDPETPAGRVILQTARGSASPFLYVPRPQARVAGERGIEWNGILLPVLGLHQAHNAAIAAAACGEVSPAALRRGLETVELPASLELFPGAPRVLLDGAHNGSSIRACLQAVADHLPGRRLALVFAVSRDKDMERIVPPLAEAVATAFCTQADAVRGAAPGALADHPAWRRRPEAVADPAAALERARAAAGPDGLVLVTGSIYLAGALRPILRSSRVAGR